MQSASWLSWLILSLSHHTHTHALSPPTHTHTHFPPTHTHTTHILGADAAYGTAYTVLGGGEAGRAGCQAIGALANIGQIDSTITNFLEPLQVRNAVTEYTLPYTLLLSFSLFFFLFPFVYICLFSFLFVFLCCYLSASFFFHSCISLFVTLCHLYFSFCFCFTHVLYIPVQFFFVISTLLLVVFVTDFIYFSTSSVTIWFIPIIETIFHKLIYFAYHY